MADLEIGQAAPPYSTVDQNGHIITSAGLLGKKVALYFYPKDDTPGCTAQACNLRDNYHQLLAAGIHVLGISTDSEKSHKKFAQKFELPFPLLVDEDHAIAEAYSVWQEKNMYGKKYMGTVRTTFVIDEQGRIENIIGKVKTDDHAAQLLQA